MARLRYNLLEATLAADIVAADTAITFTAALQEGGVDVPTIVPDDYIVFRIDQEIIYLTAYTAGATSGTISRGQEDTVAADHFAGSAVKNVITKEDVGGGGGGGFAVTVAASDSTAENQAIADFLCTGTADEVVFQTIIDTYGLTDNGTLIVRCADGTYNFDAQVTLGATIDCNIEIIGNENARLSRGSGATFEKNTTGDFSLFSTAMSGVGSLTFVGCYFNSGLSETIASPLLEVGSSDWFTLKSCVAWNYQTGITSPTIGASTSSRLWFEDCDLEGSGSVISIVGGNLTMKGCYLWGDGASSVTGTTLAASCDVLIQDCWIESGGGSAVRLDGSTGLLPQVRIVGGRFWTDAADCIYLSDISSTTIEGCEAAATNSGSMIRLNNVDLGTITGVRSFTTNVTAHHGLWMLDCENVLVEGCVFLNYSEDTDATYSGILLDGDTNNCQIIGNRLRTQTAGNQALYGIRVDDSTCDNNLIQNNDLRGSCKTNGNEISDNGTGTRGYEVIMVALGDETTPITTGTAKTTIRMPYAFCLGTQPRASLSTTSSSGNPAFDINETGSGSIFSTTLTVAAGSKTSVGGTPAVLSDRYLADDAEITFDIDTAGTGASGAKISLLGWRI
jgi:RES domain-containing protein